MAEQILDSADGPCYVLKFEDNLSHDSPCMKTTVREMTNEEAESSYEDDVYALCQYRECLTEGSKPCKFPFKFQGRMYDSCITLGDDRPWCSLAVDVDKNHIKGDANKGYCSSDCHTNNCPVGFFPLSDTCYRLSATTDNDAWENVEEAEEQCRISGARLYQPRDYKTFQKILDREADFLKSGSGFYWSATSYLAMGLKTIVTHPIVMVEYMDGSPAYVIEKWNDHSFESKTVKDIFTPESVHETGCLMLDKDGKLSVEMCSGFKSDFLNDAAPKLGYICEAKPTVTTGGAESDIPCLFPYKILPGDDWHTSCVYDSYGNDGAWCATEVDEDGVMIGGKWGTCQDERTIAYRGDGAGKHCKLPFLYNRVWYDKCKIEPREELWCPTELDESMEVIDDVTEYGYCTLHLTPVTSDCSANYNKFLDFCIRASPYPEKFDDAQEMCEKEGANLMHIMRAEVNSQLRFYIKRLENKVYFFPQYSPDISTYWVGGSVKDLHWSWIANQRNFSQYENWLAPDKGCPGGVCTDNYRLMLDVQSKFGWKAADKDKAKPYICLSKCTIGYVWQTNTRKCLKIFNITQAMSQSKAMLTCSRDHARLVAFDTCNEIEGFAKDIAQHFRSRLEEFWIGFFSGGLEHYSSRVRSTSDTLNSDGLKGVLKDCNALATDSTDGEYASLKLETLDPLAFNLEMHTFAKIDGSPNKGFACEKEEEWTCPEGFLLFQEECYKLMEYQATVIAARESCSQQNAKLVEPMTRLHTTFLNILLGNENTVGYVWTGYLRNIFNLTGKENEVFSASSWDITELFDGDLDMTENGKKQYMKLKK